jgi:hypothetical protein
MNFMSRGLSVGLNEQGFVGQVPHNKGSERPVIFIDSKERINYIPVINTETH